MKSCTVWNFSNQLHCQKIHSIAGAICHVSFMLYHTNVKNIKRTFHSSGFNRNGIKHICVYMLAGWWQIARINLRLLLEPYGVCEHKNWQVNGKTWIMSGQKSMIKIGMQQLWCGVGMVGFVSSGRLSLYNSYNFNRVMIYTHIQ